MNTIRYNMRRRITDGVVEMSPTGSESSMTQIISELRKELQLEPNFVWDVCRRIP